MCRVKAPKPSVAEEVEPVFVRNPFLDAQDQAAGTANALRRGRNSLVIPTDYTFGGREGSRNVAGTGNPQGNPRNPGSNPNSNNAGSTRGSSGSGGGARRGGTRRGGGSTRSGGGGGGNIRPGQNPRESIN